MAANSSTSKSKKKDGPSGEIVLAHKAIFARHSSLMRNIFDIAEKKQVQYIAIIRLDRRSPYCIFKVCVSSSKAYASVRVFETSAPRWELLKIIKKKSKAIMKRTLQRTLLKWLYLCKRC